MRPYGASDDLLTLTGASVNTTTFTISEYHYFYHFSYYADSVELAYYFSYYVDSVELARVNTKS